MKASAYSHSFLSPRASSHTCRERTLAFAKLCTARSPLPFAHFAMVFLRFFCAGKTEPIERNRIEGAPQIVNDGSTIAVSVGRASYRRMHSQAVFSGGDT